MKKRIFSILLIVAMLLAVFASCAKDGTPVASTEGVAPSEDSEDATTVGTQSPDPATTEPGDSTTEPSFSTEGPIFTTEPPSIEVPDTASVYSGTPDTSWYDAANPKTEYVLTSADQLLGFMKLRNDAGTDTPLTFEGVTIKLGCDMVINEGTTTEVIARGFSNHQWPELHSKCVFNGTIDGQGYMISGVYMSIYNSGYKAIFGCSGGDLSVKNLTVCNSYVGTGTDSTGVKEAVGGLFGSVGGDGSTVSFSNVTVNLVLEDRNCGYPVNKMGGFMGTLNPKNSTVTMENCKFEGRVTSTGDFAGGLVGYLSNASMNLTLKNCENAGEIAGQYYVGGLAGQLTVRDASITDCKNNGVIVAKGGKGELHGIISITNDPTNGARPTEIPEDSASLRIMSYNIRFNLPKDSSGALTQIAWNRINATKQEMLAYDADIIGIQEDRREWADFLIFDDYKVIHDASINGSAELTSLYYKKGMELLDGGTFWLNETNTIAEQNSLKIADLFEEGGKYQMTAEELALLRITKDTPDSYFGESLSDYIDYKTGEVVQCTEGTYRLLNQFPRNATYGVFNVEGQIVIAINTHLQQRTVGGEYSNDAYQKLRENERLKQLTFLKAFIDKQLEKYPNAEFVMTGDWNDTAFSNVYNVICNDYGFAHAAFSTDQKYGVHGSSNAAFDNDAGHTDNSAKEGGFGEYLDYVFATDGFTVLKALTGDGKETVSLPDGGTQVVYTSDHLPVIADLCFKKGSYTGDSGDSEAVVPENASEYSGTPDTSWYDASNPQSEYLLTTADQLMGFMYLRNQSKGAINFEGVTIKLGSNMVFNKGMTSKQLSETNAEILDVWPMLNSGYHFKGIFDGQNYTVSGIYMKLDSGSKGMFGCVAGNAEIKNLTVINSCIMGPDVNGKEDIGFLVGNVVKGSALTVSNVSVDALLKEGAGTIEYIGGLIGKVDGEVNSTTNVANSATVTMINCEFKGTLEFTNKGKTIGGLIGRAMRATSITLTNCTFSGSVNGSASCGGIVGYANVNKDRPATITIIDFTYAGKVNGADATENNKQGR